jgi:hypothetical protein
MENKTGFCKRCGHLDKARIPDRLLFKILMTYKLNEYTKAQLYKHYNIDKYMTYNGFIKLLNHYDCPEKFRWLRDRISFKEYIEQETKNMTKGA